ncbi:MAG: bifunctional serine/threonine-protein kinase/formylglycine-generating enzyme family protein [Gemmatimonadales bacterium]
MTDPLFDRLARALAGRYTLERELGQGGMATVYLGTDVKLGRQVAIKALAPQTREYLGSERFQREVQLAAQLSHPHIVPVFEAGEADGVLFYAMGYVEGESLKHRLEHQGPLPLDEAVRLIAEIGEALHYAHERGIVHRDIKPANILLSRGHAQVADFGIAKAISGDSSEHTLTGTGISVGTVEYMSPEQAAGEKRLDGRSDVYALGVLLYELLVGEPPFTGPTVQAVVARILADPPRRLRTVRATVPEHVERAVLAALSKIPADRPPTAQAFVDRLLQPAAVQGRGAGTWLAVSGVVALVAVAGFLVLRALQQAPPVPASPLGMVLVPSGHYRVGGSARRQGQTVALDAFYIDSTEVTIAAFQRFLESTTGTAPWRERPPPDWPATGILWREAKRFCEWRGVRLPTEDEWEAAARGPEGWRYPWGESWDRGRANAGAAADTLKPVGGFPLGRSFVGAVDMVGNAWEWVATEQAGPGGEVWHVIKGGAFNTPPDNAAANTRGALPDDRRFWYTGFRCARAAALEP